MKKEKRLWRVFWKRKTQTHRDVQPHWRTKTQVRDALILVKVLFDNRLYLIEVTAATKKELPKEKIAEAKKEEDEEEKRVEVDKQLEDGKA